MRCDLDRSRSGGKIAMSTNRVAPDGSGFVNALRRMELASCDVLTAISPPRPTARLSLPVGLLLLV